MSKFIDNLNNTKLKEIYGHLSYLSYQLKCIIDSIYNDLLTGTTISTETKQRILQFTTRESSIPANVQTDFFYYNDMTHIFTIVFALVSGACYQYTLHLLCTLSIDSAVVILDNYYTTANYPPSVYTDLDTLRTTRDRINECVEKINNVGTPFSNECACNDQQSNAFLSLTVDGDITVTGTVDGVDLSVFYANYLNNVDQDVSIGSSPNFLAPTITRLNNLSTNGFVRTTGGNGTLTIDTADYVNRAGDTMTGTLNMGGYGITNARLGSLVTNGFVRTSAGNGTLTIDTTVYETPLTFSTGLTRAVNTITINTTQNILKLSNLLTNGFVRTSAGDGTLIVDPTSYLTGNQTITLSGDITGSGTTAIITTIGSGVVTNTMLVGTDINVVGTITSGTWNGTLIGTAYGGTGQSTYTNGQLLIGNTTGGTLVKATLTGTPDQIIVTNGAGTITLSTPQSIAQTSTPTFTGMNLSGLTATRPLFTDASKNLTTTGTVPVNQGGTGETTYTDGQLLIGNTTGNTLTKTTLTAGTGIGVTNGSGSITLANTGVTSLASGNTNRVTVSASTGAITLSGPQDIATTSTPTFAGATLNGTLSMGGNSITDVKLGSLTDGFVKTSAGNGTLIVDPANYLTGNQNIILSGDVTGSGTTAITTAYNNTVPVNKGGTNQTTYTDGQLLIGNSTGNTLTKTTLTAGTGIGVTNGPGSITLANTGVTSLASGNTNRVTVSASTGAITLSGPQDIATTSSPTFANATLNGTLGVNTTAPGRQCEINSATGDCLRLTYNDSNGSATTYTDFKVTSTGNLEINPTNGIVQHTGGLTTGRRRMVVYDTSNDDHQYYGLAIDTNIFRIQVPNTSNFLKFSQGTSATTRRDSWMVGGSANIMTLYDTTAPTPGTTEFQCSGGALFVRPSAKVARIDAKSLEIYNGDGSEDTLYYLSAPTGFSAYNYYVSGGLLKSIVGYQQTIDSMILYHAGANRLNIVNSGSIGINTSAPDKQCEINSATGACLRLTHNDNNGSATNRCDFDVSSAGTLTITPSNANVSVIGNIVTSGSIGINTSAPNKQCEINSTTGACLRLTHNDNNGSAINRCDFDVSSVGALTITPSNANVSVIGNIVTSGLIGINTSAPDKQCEINSATGACLRLTHNDNNGSATNRCDFDVSSVGALTITPSNANVSVVGNIITTANNLYNIGSTTNIFATVTAATCRSYSNADSTYYGNGSFASVNFPNGQIGMTINRNAYAIGPTFAAQRYDFIIGSPTGGGVNRTVDDLFIYDTTSAVDKLRLGKSAGANFVRGNFSPMIDNVYSSGSVGFRWSAVHAANGTIQTSTRTLKKNIITIDETKSLDFISSMVPVSYNWKDTTYEECHEETDPVTEQPITVTETKTRCDQRKYYGLIAEDVKDSFTGIFGETVANNIVYDPDPTDGVETMGMNYVSFVPFLISSIKVLRQQIETLQQQVETLQQQIPPTTTTV